LADSIEEAASYFLKLQDAIEETLPDSIVQEM